MNSQTNVSTEDDGIHETDTDRLKQQIMAHTNLTEYKKTQLMSILDGAERCCDDSSVEESEVAASNLKNVVASLDLLRPSSSSETTKYRMGPFLKNVICVFDFLRRHHSYIYDILMSTNSSYMGAFYEFIISVRNEPILRDYLFECLLLFELFNSPSYRLVNPTTAAHVETAAAIGRQERAYKAYISPFSALHDDFSISSPFMRAVKRGTIKFTHAGSVNFVYVKDVKKTIESCTPTTDDIFSSLFDAMQRQPSSLPLNIAAYDDISLPSRRNTCQFIRKVFKTTVDATIRCALLTDMFTFNLYDNNDAYRRQFSFYPFVISDGTLR